MQKNRTQRKLPAGSPPVVTYSRRHDEELAAYEDGRAEPRFDDDTVEWEAVEVPPEPPLHARRRARPLVDEVRTPVDEAVLEDFADKKARAKRSTPLRLVAVAAVALVAIGLALLAYTFSSSTAVTVNAPALNEGGAEPGTVPAEETASTTAVREIPLTGDAVGDAAPAGPAAVSTAPVVPPEPRARPEPPPSATAAVEPDFDQAAPSPPDVAPEPQSQAATADPTPDDAFISLIERTLAENRGSSAPPPALSPAAEPGLLAPQAQPDLPVPPEDIPLVDGQGQPVTLPNDFLLLDTE
ncbi:MAG TPA: hypothetical protein VFK86_10560 [Bauldia sp.]|nr:hypothetical protein [Bauldia sp.]